MALLSVLLLHDKEIKLLGKRVSSPTQGSVGSQNSAQYHSY